MRAIRRGNRASGGLALFGAVLALAMAGCFSPQITDGQFRCGALGECPGGFYCDGVVCLMGRPLGCDAGGDASVGVARDAPIGDALRIDQASLDHVATDAPVDGPTVPIPDQTTSDAADASTGYDFKSGIDFSPGFDQLTSCSPSTLFPSDSFDASSVNMVIWPTTHADPGTSVSETGGHAVLSLAGAGPNYTSAALGSASFAIAGQRAFVEVLQMLNVNSNALATFGFVTSSGYLHLHQEANQMYCELLAQPGTVVGTPGVPYDPVAHRWWQVRETNGALYCEVSSNGVEWVQLGTHPTSGVVNATLEIGVAVYQQETDPGQLEVDNYNVCPHIGP